MIRRLVDRHPDEHKLMLHNILNCTCRSVLFFQLADAARVTSIPRHIQTDFVRLATLFSLYFKQLLKLQPVHRNVATLSPKTNNFLSLLGDFP
jgi:hypothetical protein